MNSIPPDIHDDEPTHRHYLSKTGIKGYPVTLKIDLLGCKERLFIADAYIDLPAYMRGAHISRLAKSIEYAIDKDRCLKPAYIVDELTKAILESHERSGISEVRLKTILSHGQGTVDLVIGGIRDREKGVEHYLTVSLKGITACPCAKEVYRFYENTDEKSTPTHMQRAIMSVTLRGKNILEDEILLSRLISLSRKSFSAETSNILGRKEEYLLIKKAFNNPLFAEDVVRNMLQALKETIPPHTNAVVEVESMESIHEYNIYVKGELRP